MRNVSGKSDRIYMCIDLKSFYASVECAERGLNPMTTNLVVADPERSTGTLCLAVSPSMKALGVRNRCRLYEIPENIEYIAAVPRMQLYIDYAVRIYGEYLKYISPDDIHVYSVDEAFFDVTEYVRRSGMTPEQMARFLMGRVEKCAGIRSTAGIGTNLYLAKVALDITAKHSPKFIGYLDEEKYREELWDHRPLTDFWRIGRGTAARLDKLGIRTMREITRANEDTLYKIFGIDAELLIDHAWGRESTTMADIKGYRSKSRSLSSGQVLLRDYDYDEARLIVKEMADLVCLDMVEKNIYTDLLTLYVGYSHTVPIPPSGGSIRLPRSTNADSLIIPALVRKYNEIVVPGVPIRRIGIGCENIVEDEGQYQMSLFDEGVTEETERDRKIQEAVLEIKARFGKNAILKGLNLEEAGTTRARNHQIGGHKSGT
ncbi:MAG: DNA repair protein [Oscillospiraceae bacterium]|nr:DNA repair protein [Oscillospiraceae bacterium]